MLHHFNEIADIRKELSAVLQKYVDQASIDALFKRSTYALKQQKRMPSREEICESAGVDDFIRRLNRIKDNSLLGKLAKHIKKLVEAPLVSQLSEMNLNGEDYGAKKDFSDKLFELYMATLIVPFCQEIEIDDPYHSKAYKSSRSPKAQDIVAEIDGKLWSFECKVISSNTPNRVEAYIGLLDKALEQLSHVPTVYNVPLFAFRQQVPVDEIWPLTSEGLPSAWDSLDQPAEICRAMGGTIRAEFQNEQFRNGCIETINRWNQGGILSHATLNFFSATTAVKFTPDPVPVTIKELQLWPFGPIDCEIKVMGQRINDQLHFL